MYLPAIESPFIYAVTTWSAGGVGYNGHEVKFVYISCIGAYGIDPDATASCQY